MHDNFFVQILILIFLKFIYSFKYSGETQFDIIHTICCLIIIKTLEYGIEDH